MKISETIKRLKKIQKGNGDLTLCLYDNIGNTFGSPSFVVTEHDVLHVAVIDETSVESKELSFLKDKPCRYCNQERSKRLDNCSVCGSNLKD